MDEQDWRARTRSETCPFCRQLLEADREDPYGLPVAELPSGRVRLSRNQTRYGYCILISRHHVLELHDLEPKEREMLIHDVARVSRAVQGLRNAEKMNVQFLGNGVAHLHAHIFPRYLSDPDFGRYPEDKTTPFTKLEPQEMAALRQKLADALTLPEPHV